MSYMGWPWACLDCGRTLFHDAPYCRECEERDRLDRWTRTPGRRDRLVRWLRRRSHVGFVLAVLLIVAIVELAAIGLLLSLLGVPVVDGVLPLPRLAAAIDALRSAVDVGRIDPADAAEALARLLFGG